MTDTAEPVTVDTPLAQFGRHVAELRMAARKTQPEVCEAASIGRATLSALENGHRDIGVSRLPALAKALEVSVGELLRGLPPQV